MRIHGLAMGHGYPWIFMKDPGICIDTPLISIDNPWISSDNHGYLWLFAKLLRPPMSSKKSCDDLVCRGEGDIVQGEVG